MNLALLQDARWFPTSASTMAREVDWLYLSWIVVAVLFSAGISVALVYLGVRFRRSRSPRPERIDGSLQLEILWSAIPLLICLGFFGWGTKLFVDLKTIPEDGLQITVTGKQWMWKLQHPTGQREINTLHVPLGRKVILTMTSEDVIHSFYVPAFRVKQDVVPGMYSQTWFEPTREGSFHLFCAEYCGADHSRMIGRVIVMAPEAYEAWLSGQPEAATPREAGEALFSKLRCDSCHAAGSGQRGPDLAGRFGLQAVLQDGSSVPFDEEYVRESILEPQRRIARGFEPVMPTYAGQVTEEEILQLIAYLRELGADSDQPGPAGTEAAAPAEDAEVPVDGSAGEAERDQESSGGER